MSASLIRYNIVEVAQITLSTFMCVLVALQLLRVAYQKNPRVLLKPDGRYSLGDQCPSGLSG